MTMQPLLGLGKNESFLGYSMTAASFTNNLTFNYPTSKVGDLIIAYITASNMTVPKVDSSWTVLYSNSTTAVDGSSGGRLLIYKRRGYESSANVYVSGGGNCTCVGIRGALGKFRHVAEFVANNSLGNTSFSANINAPEIQLAMVNQVNGQVNAIITIANTTASFHNEPGYFRSMAIGYELGPNNNIISVNTSVGSVYGVYLKIA